MMSGFQKDDFPPPNWHPEEPGAHLPDDGLTPQQRLERERRLERLDNDHMFYGPDAEVF